MSKRTKKHNTEITKAMLEEWGIQSVTWDDSLDNWRIERLWNKNKSKKKVLSIVKIGTAVCKHQYAQDKTYPIVSFSAHGNPQCFPLSRFIYAWFNGEVPEGMVVDHIDNNPFNNRIENLQILTPEDNLKKRFIDNPNNCKNQIQYIHRK